MAQISNYGMIAQLRADASHHIIRYKSGKMKQSGRGIVCWFRPGTASIVEVPLDDREMSLFVKGRSADFQDVNVQGVLGWRVVEPEKLAERIDFTIGLRSGQYLKEPLERIETRLRGLINQAALQYLAEKHVRELLDFGVDPLRESIEAALASEQSLADIGIEIVNIRLDNLAPTSELQRALQTPTFEALQQKADEAVYERRAIAVEKERAIAENELVNKVELAKQEKQLIAEETGNAKDRAQGIAQAQQIESDAEANRIRVVDGAKAEAQKAQMDVYQGVAPAIILGLAVREFAQKLDRIEHLNITPDMVASLLKEFGGKSPPAPPLAALE